MKYPTDTLVKGKKKTHTTDHFSKFPCILKVKLK